MADRARRMGAGHRVVPESAADRPKPLDMSDLAARNRQARTAGREERPAAAATPPPETAMPRTALSMAERAARHTLGHRVDAQEAPTPAASVLAPPSASPPARAAPTTDDAMTMAERAADAVHRRREAAQSGSPAATPVTSPRTPDVIAGATAFFVVSRNHAGVLADRLRGWQLLLDAVDVRWGVLDLGSTDSSAAEAESVHATLLTRPGGLVDPLATLQAVLRQTSAEVIVLADAHARPGQDLLAVLQAVRNGRMAAAAPAHAPQVLALSRKAWLAKDFAKSADLRAWAAQDGGVALLSGVGDPPSEGFVQAAVRAPKLRRLLTAAKQGRDLALGLLAKLRQ